MSAERLAAEARLPNAEPQYPLCGACYSETDYDGDFFHCYDCRLDFDERTFAVEYSDPTDTPCGNVCADDHSASVTSAVPILSRMIETCKPCALPAGHASPHWPGHMVRLESNGRDE